jgi:hypothetical protein
LNTDDIASPAGAKTEITFLSSNELIAQLCDARDQLDEGVELLSSALDLRELLYMGVLDMDEARHLVHELKVGSIKAHRRPRT